MNGVADDWRPCRAASIEQNDLPDGTILYDPARQTVHQLNATAMLVWELIDGRTVAEITTAVATVLEVGSDQASGFVREALTSFVSRDLVS